MEIPLHREGREQKMVIDMLQSRRGRRKEEMEIPLRREGREQKMVIDMLPFPTLIPVDDNDLKSLARSVDVVDSKTLVAPESAFLTGGNTAHTVDVSDMAPMVMALPQKAEGGVTGRTETASRSPTTTRL